MPRLVERGAVDYGAWVRRLQAFIEGLRERSRPENRDFFRIEVAPPLTQAELKELEEKGGVSLPPPLRAFLTQGAASVKFQFGWPPNEPQDSWIEEYELFCPAQELIGWHESCVSHAQNSGLSDPEWPLDYAFWRHAWLLTCDPAWDGVALWCHSPDQPHYPVLCLDHEDKGYLVAPTFDEFLRQWEQLGYLSWGALLDYRDEDGFLHATTPEAGKLRKELGLSS